MDAERAACQIVEAVRGRRAEIILTPADQVVSRVASLSPGLTSAVLRLVQKLALPRPAASGTGGAGTPGYRLNPAMNPKTSDRLTILGRAAASRFSERRRSADRELSAGRARHRTGRKVRLVLRHHVALPEPCS
jgi:hypothetical protein